MLSVRLQRVGRKNDPSFRMVIIDSKRSVKSANYIEMVGSYNPRQKTVDVKADRVKHWIAQGAKPTDTVHNILISQKVIEGKKVNPLGKKTPVVKEKKEDKAETKDTVEAEAAEPEAEATAAEPEAVDNSADSEAPKEKKKEETETPKEEPKLEPAEEPAVEEDKKKPVKPEPVEDNAPKEAVTKKEDKKEEAA